MTPIPYIAVSGICIVAHNVVMISADSLGLPLWAAVAISFCVVVVTGYVLHGIFTFRRPLNVAAFL
ncbi:hypothetical protein, partial [Microbacterium sp. SCN 71-17]|uniref:hypothetical protein n=1 Tax=Microbacterium sp. SCN 71-17 TaxID=1660111 RepID=UPI0025D597F6